MAEPLGVLPVLQVGLRLQHLVTVAGRALLQVHQQLLQVRLERDRKGRWGLVRGQTGWWLVESTTLWSSYFLNLFMSCQKDIVISNAT